MALGKVYISYYLISALRWARSDYVVLSAKKLQRELLMVGLSLFFRSVLDCNLIDDVMGAPHV